MKLGKVKINKNKHFNGFSPTSPKHPPPLPPPHTPPTPHQCGLFFFFSPYQLWHIS